MSAAAHDEAPWRKALDAFNQTRPSAVALGLLKRIAAAIEAAPRDLRVRKLALEKVEGKLEGGVDVLQAAGFAPAVSDDQTVLLVLPLGDEYDATIRELNAYVHSLC